jgi:hypothetical protein
VHLYAGGLVAWLCFEILEPRTAGCRWSRIRLALLAFGMAMGFGIAKEVTDFLSV